MTLEPVHDNPIQLRQLPDAFGARGYEIARPDLLIREVGYGGAGELTAATSLRVVSGGVHTAPVGVIQDPAGSAIGSGGRPSGAGASGAIYAAFPDLHPIPGIVPRAAVFNSSSGPGRRVLHTHSPQLAGSPPSPEACRRALEDLANSYANALIAVERRGAELGTDGAVLNLVPVSAAIYAGHFRHRHLDHLHPSYSITAVLLAVGCQRAAGGPVPQLALWYFSPTVYDAATAVLDQLR